MGRLEDDGRRDSRVERLVPALSHDAPAVAGLETREKPLGPGRREVVAARPRELEELLRHHGADDVEAGVAAGTAVAVAMEARHGIERTRLEVAAEDVHDRRLRPAGDEPATAAEAREHGREAHEDEGDERRPHAADSPVLLQHDEEDGRAREEGG
jgi:hypothetical protein